jgi:hypothetical protein
VRLIPGRRGHVEAHDLVTLSVYVSGRPYLLRVLRALPDGWRRHQVGDHEANLLAPADDLETACRVVRAYRRPRLTDEQRTARLARLGIAQKRGRSEAKQAAEIAAAGVPMVPPDDAA